MGAAGVPGVLSGATILGGEGSTSPHGAAVFPLPPHLRLPISTCSLPMFWQLKCIVSFPDYLHDLPEVVSQIPDFFKHIPSVTVLPGLDPGGGGGPNPDNQFENGAKFLYLKDKGTCIRRTKL